MSYLFPALGASIALAGSDKLACVRSYDGMFRGLGWSRDAMQIVAAAEVAGGLLMIPRPTRDIGGALVFAASAAVLASELDHGERKLAVPRGVVLVAALLAIVGGVAARHSRAA